MTKTASRRRWFPWLVGAVGTAIVVIAVIFAGRGGPELPAANGDGAPRVAVHQEVFDYGDVVVNTPVETVFRVTNIGEGTLRVLGTPEVKLVEGC